MRFVIACGGTGGHFFPGLVLGKTLKARGHEPLFILRTGDPAAARLDAEDLPHTALDLRGLNRRPSLSWITTPVKTLQSLLLAKRILRDFRPDAAVGMGGYLTLPVAWAARGAGVPYILHESNAQLGLANRLAAVGASTLALGLPLQEGVPKNGELTGTPIRRELWSVQETEASRSALGLAPGLRTLLIFGGSQGARALNRIMPAAVGRVAEEKGPLQVLHLAGPGREDEARGAYGDAPGSLSLHIRGALSDMGQAYAAADLVICRAGASTIAELAAQKRPAILVPFPAAAGGHQETNARVLEEAGAVRMALEPGADDARFAQILSETLDDGALERMSQAYGSLRLPAPSESAERLADIVVRASKGYLKPS